MKYKISESFLIDWIPDLLQSFTFSYQEWRNHYQNDKHDAIFWVSWPPRTQNYTHSTSQLRTKAEYLPEMSSWKIVVKNSLWAAIHPWWRVETRIFMSATTWRSDFGKFLDESPDSWDLTNSQIIDLSHQHFKYEIQTVLIYPFLVFNMSNVLYDFHFTGKIYQQKSSQHLMKQLKLRDQCRNLIHNERPLCCIAPLRYDINVSPKCGSTSSEVTIKSMCDGLLPIKLVLASLEYQLKYSKNTLALTP